MSRFRMFVSVAVVGLICVGGLVGDDKTPVKAKGQLPANWSKLGLTDAQKQDIYTKQSEYRTKIAELEAKIKDLKKAEREDLEKVLTDAQKARLKEILLDKAPSDKKDKDKDKPKETEKK